MYGFPEAGVVGHHVTRVAPFWNPLSPASPVAAAQFLTTWNKPDGPYSYVAFYLSGAGGGGGSGRRDVAGVIRSGGGGGGSGSFLAVEYPYEMVPTSVTLAIGIAGAGGAVPADTTNGNAGVAGGSTRAEFSNAGIALTTIGSASGGGGGGGGTATTGGTAGSAGAAATAVGLAGGAGGANGIVGSSSASPQAVAVSGQWMRMSGGGGGGYTAANATSNGGTVTDAYGSGQGAGSATASALHGWERFPASGTGTGLSVVMRNFVYPTFCAVGGGGGGGTSNATDASGGHGGFGGGGGGGGAGTINASGIPGNGGNGGHGCAVIVCY